MPGPVILLISSTMRLLDLTLDTPAENLALEEALLEYAESEEAECIRLWESAGHFVVLGAGSPIRSEVNLSACEADDIPVLRRISGGGTVLQGPGCLNYTIVLDRENRTGLDTIVGTNSFVLGKIGEAIVRCGHDQPAIQGISDLTNGPLKFSGNAQRRRKRFVLFHGTILHNFDLELISKYLGNPEKMPDYREARDHRSFLMNLDVDAAPLREAIIDAWGAADPIADWPAERTKKLARTKYADQDWIRSI